jgi:CheY-like chemotaxis protein
VTLELHRGRGCDECSNTGYAGRRALYEVRRDGFKVPAIAITAFARTERTRALLAGYQMHLAKPVEPAELLAAVAALCDRRTREN